MRPDKLLSFILASALATTFFPAYSLAQERSSGEPTAAIKKGETLGLQRCVEIALENQPAITSAMYQKQAAESRVGEAKTGYYPQVNLYSSYSQSQPVLGAQKIPEYQQYSVGANLSQTIYDFGRTSSFVGSTKFSAEAAGSDVDNARLTAILGVKTAYYAFLQAKRTVVVNKETSVQLQEHLDFARASFEVGERARYDVIKAEVDLSNAKIAVIHALNSERLAKLNLDAAMGVDAEYDVVDDMDYKKYSVDHDEALKMAFENRPDIRSLLLRTQGAEQTTAAAVSGYYPTLSGTAQYSTQAAMPDSWGVGLMLTVPIFSGFSTKYTVAESRANYNSMVASRQQLSISVYNEVNQAYLNMREAEETIPASELSLKLARENLDIAEGRYKEGVGSSIEVSDAQITYSNANLAHIQALLNYKLTQATLEKAIGGKQ